MASWLREGNDDQPLRDYLSGTILVEIFGVNGYHFLRGAYVSKKGINLEEIPQLFLSPEAAIPLSTKRGQWYASYSAQQYPMHNPENPAIGWGFFAQTGISDGNGTPSNGASSLASAETISWRAERMMSGALVTSITASANICSAPSSSSG